MPRWTPHDFRRTLASWASEKSTHRAATARPQPQPDSRLRGGEHSTPAPGYGVAGKPLTLGAGCWRATTARLSPKVGEHSGLTLCDTLYMVHLILAHIPSFSVLSEH